MAASQPNHNPASLRDSLEVADFSQRQLGLAQQRVDELLLASYSLSRASLSEELLPEKDDGKDSADDSDETTDLGLGDLLGEGGAAVVTKSSA